MSEVAPGLTIDPRLFAGTLITCNGEPRAVYVKGTYAPLLDDLREKARALDAETVVGVRQFLASDFGDSLVFFWREDGRPCDEAGEPVGGNGVAVAPPAFDEMVERMKDVAAGKEPYGLGLIEWLLPDMLRAALGGS